MTPNRVISGRCLAQLPERLAIALEEPIEQDAADRGRRVPERSGPWSSVTPRSYVTKWSHVKRPRRRIRVTAVQIQFAT